MSLVDRVGWVRAQLGSLVLVWTIAFGSNPAAAANDQAAEYQKKAKTAFALGNYSEAAEAFENAYKAGPDPALLYNAAQSYRLAGNKERALTLYENYLRVYGGEEKRTDIETRIDELKKAIEHDKVVATRPPNETEPVGAPAKPAAPPPAAPQPRSAPPVSVLSSQPAAPPVEERSVLTRPWFWGVVGGVLVAGVVLAIVLSGGSKDPTPNLGRLDSL